MNINILSSGPFGSLSGNKNKSSLKVHSLILLYFGSLFLLSCGKDNPKPSGNKDLPEKPEISMLEVSPQIQTLEICGEEDPRSIALSSKDTLSLTFNIKALHGLSQYKIDIHSNFDCHSHGRVAKTTGIPWKVLDIKNITGQDITVTEKLAVPDNIETGNYHFMLQALDQLGNEAEWVLYSLKVQNQSDTETPEITLINPSIDSMSISGNENFHVEMNISDNNNLYGGRVEVTYRDPSEIEYTADQYYFPESAGSELKYNFSFTFPSTPASDTYVFLFRVFDAVGNETEKRIKVHVE